ncbi:MAG: DUF5060 domain-containing protein [Rikenellaceae bacterium]
MRLIVTFLFALLFSAIPAHATIKRVESSTSKRITADRFEVIDIPFKAKESSDKPFEVAFNALFTSPSGVKQSVPGFYNGDKEWLVRFSAAEAGEWSFTTTSDFKSLNGKSGKITISDKSYANRRGMMTISEDNPRFFEWQDGSPYFLLAFECDFLFALDYNEKQTPRLNNFIDRVAEQGFNHFVMNVYAHDVVWTKDAKLKDKPQYEFGGDQTIFPFGGSNENPDHSTLNIDFFKHFDRTVEALNDRNIIAHLMIYVWNKAVNWAEYSSEDDNRYYDYVIKRYQAFSNVVWDVSKEAILYDNVGDEYIVERAERGRKLDSFGHLLTVHDYGFCSRNTDVVDFISRQDWTVQVNEKMLRSYNQFKDKPIFNIEHGGYEECDYEVFCGNYINAEYCLRRSYEALFASVYTTYYWQGCSWNVLIYDFDTLPEGCYRPKLEYYKYKQEFFTKYPFHDFKPEPLLTNSGYCMSNSAEDTYLFYMPKESYKASAGKIMKKCNKLSFQWFNTHTGEYSDVWICDDMTIFSMPLNPWHLQNDAIMIITVLEVK